MATVISFTFREAMADVEYQGYCIPKGWKVLPLFRSIHHNPDFFTDPGKFNPSRFEWEIKGPSCFMENRTFLVIRLISGVIFQFWCSYITFPLYVIVTQMGSKFKKSVVAESVRDSLQGWRQRAKKSRPNRSPTSRGSVSSVTSVDYVVDETNKGAITTPRHTSLNLLRSENGSSSCQPARYVPENETHEQASSDDSYASHGSGPHYDSYSDDDDDKDEKCLFPRQEFS